MAVEVEFSHRARAELRELTIYLVENASRRVADRAVRAILRKIDGLRTFPRAARIRPELEGERRLVVSRPYLIIYTVTSAGTKDTVVVLHIVHGARDLSSLMTDD